MTIYSSKNLPDKNKSFIFDTNFLYDLYIEYNPYRNDKVEIISDFLIKNNCKIILDTLVLNEFVNRFLKDRLPNIKFKEKKYRNTNEYNKTLLKLYTIINNIKIAYRIEYPKNQVNILEILTKNKISYYNDEFNKMEFSDWTIKETAKQNNAILITNDNDFKSCEDIDILTI